jgi:uncharacterized protein YdiU (UPF0061 family)
MAKTREEQIQAITDELKKYTKDINDDLVAAMVKTYSLVLSKPNAQLVACGEEAELQTVKSNFMKKKLGLTTSDEEMDAQIKSVCETMKASKRKNRVVFYYLLVKETGKESVFI